MGCQIPLQLGEEAKALDSTSLAWLCLCQLFLLLRVEEGAGRPHLFPGPVFKTRESRPPGLWSQTTPLTRMFHKWLEHCKKCFCISNGYVQKSYILYIKYFLWLSPFLFYLPDVLCTWTYLILAYGVFKICLNNMENYSTHFQSRSARSVMHYYICSVWVHTQADGLMLHQFLCIVFKLSMLTSHHRVIEFF
jgi:hypothetical protein